MPTGLIPVVDLRLLSQEELATLSQSCPNAFDLRRCDDVVVPSIDRSVFNESAGSRKQTYSRLRLAPHPSHDPTPSSSSVAAAGRLPRSLLSSSSSNPDADDPDDPGRRENQKIVFHLRQLFAGEDPSLSAPAPVPAAAQALTLAVVSRDPVATEGKTEPQPPALLEDGDREVLGASGALVDLAALGAKTDPFAEELRRRTAGLESEEELLGFLNGLEGQWGSRRKRRKIVDAAAFGDHLPRGWKLLLGLKRKEGVAWIFCRRYVSPNGHQFVTCKEVSLYISSLIGHPGAVVPVSVQSNGAAAALDKSTDGSSAGFYQHNDASIQTHNLSAVVPVPVSSINYENHAANYRSEKQATSELTGTQECRKCNLNFADKGAYLQHQLSFHQRSLKRRRVSRSVVNSAVIKDGKYECQFCHKTFDEKPRYFGHIGAHIRYQGLSMEAFSDANSVGKTSNPSSLSATPCDSEIIGLPEQSAKNGASESAVGLQTISDVSHVEVADVLQVNNAGCTDKSSLDNITDEKADKMLQANTMVNDENKSNVGTVSSHTLEANTVAQNCSSSATIEKPLLDSNVTCENDGEVVEANSEDKLKPNYVQGIVCDIVRYKAEEVDENSKLKDDRLNSCLDPSSSPLADSNNGAIESETIQIESTAKVHVGSSEEVDDDNSMQFQPNMIIDSVSPSLIVMDNRTPEMGLTSCSVISELEDNCKERILPLECQLMGLTGNGLCYDSVTYTNDPFTATMADDGLKQVGTSVGELKPDFSSCFSLSELNTAAQGAATEQLDAHCVDTPLVDGHGSAIEANASSTFDIDMNNSMQDLEKPNCEVENHFNVSDTGSEKLDGSATAVNAEGVVPMEVNMDGFLPFLHSANGASIANMMPDKRDFEELRLVSAEPSEFVCFTGEDSMPVAESPMVLDYASELGNASWPSLQLGWDVSSPKLVSRFDQIAMCVWCGRELRLDGPITEQQSDTLGFICPSCKEKFSGTHGYS